MAIIVTCPSCGHKTKAPDSAAGKTGKCPHCGSPVIVPRPDIGLLAEPDVVDAEVIDAEVVEAPAPAPAPASRPPASAPKKPAAPVEDDEPIGLADPTLSVQGREPPPDETQLQPCPSCGEMISATALRCRFCRETVDPELKKREAKKKRGNPEDIDMGAGDWVVALICSGIGCIVGIVWIIQGKPKGIKMLAISFCMAILWSIVRFVIEVALAQQP